MRALHCGPWTLLVVVVLADAAPAPSCGRSSNEGYLQIGASNCACAPGTIQVSLDGGNVGAITCGPNNGMSVKTEAGHHVVSASSTSASWAEQGHDVRADRTTYVELGCP